MQPEAQREPQKTMATPSKMVAGERELTTGLLSKSASFRLIVNGDVGVKEIERLIAKLQLDKEILADPDSSFPDVVESPSGQAQVSFFITNAQKNDLRKQGYTDDAIAKMKPADAHKLLKIA